MTARALRIQEGEGTRGNNTEDTHQTRVSRPFLSNGNTMRAENNHGIQSVVGHNETLMKQRVQLDHAGGDPVYPLVV